MDYQQITVDIVDSVLTVTLNRPDKLNAWTQRMESEFRHAVTDAAGVFVGGIHFSLHSNDGPPARSGAGRFPVERNYT